MRTKEEWTKWIISWEFADLPNDVTQKAIAEFKELYPEEVKSEEEIIEMFNEMAIFGDKE